MCTPGRHVSRNLELYLMGFSVAMALLIPLAIEVGTDEQELAITALAACVFQGLVFWALRRRYRRVRGEIIAELRAMLKDRINNHLTVVLMSVAQRRDRLDSATERELLEAAIAATANVSRVLEELSIESLRTWKARYQMEDLKMTHRSRASTGNRGTTPDSEQQHSRQAQQQQEPTHVGKGRHEDR